MINFDANDVELLGFCYKTNFVFRNSQNGVSRILKPQIRHHKHKGWNHADSDRICLILAHVVE
jgi:hypothetical protein